ncbi:50S ribosomal protein L4 [candidate division KSB1 bacterium]
METNIYNQEGKATGKVKLPEAIFGLKWNGDLVHQVVIGMQANKRTPIAHTKNRGEVSGGGKKPWRQKGTGRARHGSSRSPIWRGGGITFGPRNDKDYSKKINKKMKTKALYVALSQKLRDGEILFVDTISLSAPKTSGAKNVLTALSSVDGFNTLVSKKNNSALVALNEKDSVVEKSFDNMGNIEVDEVRNLNTLDVLTYKYIIITKPEEAVAFFGSKSESTTSVNKKEDLPAGQVGKKVEKTKTEEVPSSKKEEVKKPKAAAKKAPSKKAAAKAPAKVVKK